MPNVMFMPSARLYKTGASYVSCGGMDKTALAHARFYSAMLKLAVQNPQMGWFGEQTSQPVFASARQRAMANNPMADKIIAQTEKADISGLQRFVQSNPELRAAMARSPLAKHMPESAMANVLLMSRKGNESAMDTARRVGIMGTPSQSNMLQQLRDMSIPGVPKSTGPSPTPALTRSTAAGTAAAGLRPSTSATLPKPVGLKPGGTLRSMGTRALGTIGRALKIAA